MTPVFEQRLQRFVSNGEGALLRGGRIGLEKETLRVGSDGYIAQTSHPPQLGAALTNPYITTDYSEALLEFITPPFADVQQALEFLTDIHQFVYRVVGEEMLWATSMPCVVAAESAIPIARYGTSNLGMFKHIYRRGLGHRYGHMMQIIAGIHFNYSLPEAFWPAFQDHEKDTQRLQNFRSSAYFALIRNLQRFGWLIPYLFGASPAVCKSFLAGRPTPLREFDSHTVYGPYATSLRMSDIGYTNRREKKTGLNVSYNSLDAYLASLNWAIKIVCPDYEKIGVVVDSQYKQLNAHILQIENEYYSSMRPKQVPQGQESPNMALKRRGVQYVELRSLDVDAFEPVGMHEAQLRFLEAFLLFCLLEKSPPIGAHERREIDENQLATALQGRDPSLRLQRNGDSVSLKQWALEILGSMAGICEVLDAGEPKGCYTRALAYQRAAVAEPARTPSARMLAEMRSNRESFFEFAKRQSQRHQHLFTQLPVNFERMDFFAQQSQRSWEQQRQLEAEDTLSFEAYVRHYFDQS